jgi:hypothetical protein
MKAGMLVRTSESPLDVAGVRVVWPRAGDVEGLTVERSLGVVRAPPVAGVERFVAPVFAR